MARVYVGNLPLDIRTRDIEDLFWKYGRIRDIDLKTPSRPPAFAFVSFENFNDAEDAIRGRDGVQFEGSRLRCELSRGSADQRGGGYGGDRGGGYDDRGGEFFFLSLFLSFFFLFLVVSSSFSSRTLCRCYCCDLARCCPPYSHFHSSTLRPEPSHVHARSPALAA
mmetsp:Transcript_16340/g.38941  ORF Transcript_16340/g.38941 Transcript_16340/m.38941 type:complete len:166 (+) Transcript_16340:713-1210(+)